MIPETVSTAVQNLVAQGTFHNEAEAYESFLQAWQQNRAMHHEWALLAEAEQGGPSIDAETVFADIRQRLARMPNT